MLGCGLHIVLLIFDMFICLFDLECVVGALDFALCYVLWVRFVCRDVGFRFEILDFRLLFLDLGFGFLNVGLWIWDLGIVGVVFYLKCVFGILYLGVFHFFGLWIPA